MKINVTPELAVLIRTIRTRRGISAKELASDIGRSPSYLSKLESGSIRSIRRDELTGILDRIAEGESFFDEKLLDVIRTLATIIEPDEILGQSWLIQYDTFERPITIPEDFALEIRGRLEALGMTEDELADIINANKDVKDPDSIPANEIVMMDYPKGKLFRMKASVSADQIRAITSCKDLTTNYGTIYSIMFVVVKLEKYGDIGHMDPPEAREVLRETGRSLALHDVYSLTKYGQILSSGEFQSNQLLVIDTFDKVDSNTINSLIEMFRSAAEYDRAMFMDLMDSFFANMEWDTAFMFKLIGTRFYELGELSHTNKQQLIDDIQKLFARYESMSDFEKRLERY